MGAEGGPGFRPSPFTTKRLFPFLRLVFPAGACWMYAKPVGMDSTPSGIGSRARRRKTGSVALRRSLLWPFPNHLFDTTDPSQS